MNRNKIGQVVIILMFVSFFAWIIYTSIIPEKIYTFGQKHPSIEIILNKKPYFHFIGLDQPFYYNLETNKYSNSFRISDFVLDLVQDNDSTSTAIKKLDVGDTILIYIDSSSFFDLNNNSNNIEILGLAIKNNFLIDPDKIEKYQKGNILDRRFAFFVIAVIFFFIIRNQIKSKKK
jgi:hypothetical protein